MIKHSIDDNYGNANDVLLPLEDYDGHSLEDNDGNYDNEGLLLDDKDDENDGLPLQQPL